MAKKEIVVVGIPFLIGGIGIGCFGTWWYHTWYLKSLIDPVKRVLMKMEKFSESLEQIFENKNTDQMVAFTNPLKFANLFIDPNPKSAFSNVLVNLGNGGYAEQAQNLRQKWNEQFPEQKID